MLEKRLAAVWHRLQRIADAGDPSPALEPRALAEAQQLTELLRTKTVEFSDVTAWYALGWLHFHRYTALPDGRGGADLDAAVEAFVRPFLAGVSSLPRTVLPLLADAVEPQAFGLLRQALTAMDPDSLSAAVGLWQQLVHATPVGHHQRARRLHALGMASRTRFDRTGDLSNLDQAVDCFQEAVRGTPTEHPERAARLSNLGATLGVRYERTGDLSDLDQAISTGREAVRATPADTPDRAVSLSILGVALRDRFERTGDASDLDEAVAVGREAVRDIPAGHPHQSVCLSSLGATLGIRYERTGDASDLDQAITLGREAVRSTPAGHPDRDMYLSNLSATLRARFDRSGDPSDLDQAIDHLREAVRVAPAGHPNRAGYLSNLGVALHDRFRRTGNLPDLDQAITTGRDAVRASPAGHPQRRTYLANLEGALRDRFERTEDVSDLDEAVAIGREVVRSTPTHHPDRAGSLARLGQALLSRYERTGDPSDLDQAIDRLQNGLHATPAGHPDRARFLHNLGTPLLTRYQRTGDPSDLDQAIDRLQDAVRTAPAGHPDRAVSLSALGAGLRTRFERTGDLSDLDQAIDRHRDALLATPADHAHRAVPLNNLGNALRTRFERTGDLSDLDQAVDCLQEAVGVPSADHANRAGRLSNLGQALLTRFERTGDVSDLDRAVTAGREAVRTIPADHPNRAVSLSHLGHALLSRFERTGDLLDLGQAVDQVQEALLATPAHHVHRATYLNDLGVMLFARFARTGDLPDLDRAVATGREAVRATPTDHPDRAWYLSNLGAWLLERFERTADQTDLHAAMSALTEAGDVIAAAPSVRILALREVSRLAARWDVGRAADAAEAAVRLLPEVTLRRLGRGDQQYELGRFAGLAGDAAALALADPRASRTERATRALRLLEAGRAVLLSQALDTRSDLTDLNREHPELAARFLRLRDHLDQPTNTTTPADAGEETTALTVRQDRAVHDRHRLARDFAQTLAEIRDLDGFSSFALPPPTEELLTQAEQGPVVVFNISRYRSDALLLTRNGITHLDLPHLTTAALTETVASFQEALHTATTGRDRTQRRQGQDVMTGVLQWLWDTVAGPVLEALGHHRQPPPHADWPQVWWAPGGLLGLLPLAAAGYHDDPADDPHRRAVMDRVVSSHTPTVRALRYARQHARKHTPSPHTDPRGLIVAMPTTPGLPYRGRLNHVSAEAEILRRHLPSTVLLCEPEPGSDSRPGTSRPSTPTRASVLDHLPHCPIAHFACHGASHPTDPSQSLLLLHDHQSAPLTVASLVPVRLDHAQLAYLSACRTAAIDSTDLADESIHLASAFQLAGFPHVVGTLWEIDDQIAVTVADTFYTHLRAPDGTIDTGRAALALHQAVRRVRDGHDLPGQLTRCRTPFLWAAYLHAGA
ncbi:CHAT domain-containing protein [Streptomyces achromogenes]|uniref:CHAT domain-containing protein n=1 Tax=Streptomyces achromogenes TaxID=67255 RepID=UPI0033C775D0